MPRRPTPTLTEAEQRLMEVVWSRGSATVQDVVDALSGPDAPVYNTVLTTLRILERKGYLRHTQRGRAFVYHPRVDRAQARRRALADLVRRFFGGSNRELALELFEEGDVDLDELEELRSELERDEGRDAPRGGGEDR
ncbi:MAG: BlaI/MecI/CopY family transcriptional regulator [Planctomycetota bacterium JB042]